MQRAVHAHRALPQRFGHARHVAQRHEGLEDLQLLQGDVFVDGHVGAW
jgi:hypothetical protein